MTRKAEELDPRFAAKRRPLVFLRCLFLCFSLGLTHPSVAISPCLSLYSTPSFCPWGGQGRAWASGSWWWRSIRSTPGLGWFPGGSGQRGGGGSQTLRSFPTPRSVSDPAQGGRVCPGALLQPCICFHREPYLWGEGGEAGIWGGEGRGVPGR